jgi:hypothetical protein
MPERKSKHPFPWVALLILIGLLLLAHAPFDDGQLQQLDIVFGITLLAVASVLSFTTSLSTKKRVYLAFDQGPQCGLTLTRDYGISPSKVFVILRKWRNQQWIAPCAAPEEYESARSDQTWYCLTMRGLKELPPSFELAN